MLDRDIRQMLHSGVLRKFHNDRNSLVFDEFSVCAGETRVDIAVVNGHLHGYEIKSDNDTLLRLPAQVVLYSKVLDYSTLVVGEQHLEQSCLLIPDWWGMLVAVTTKKGKEKIVTHRKSSKNPSPDAFAIAQLLWKQEALLILSAHDMAKGLVSQPRKKLWQILSSRFSHNELSWMVRNALKLRTDWRENSQPISEDLHDS